MPNKDNTIKQEEAKKLIQGTFLMFSDENIDFLLQQTLYIIDKKQFLNNALTLDDLSELLSQPIAEITQYSTPEERSDFLKTATKKESIINYLHKNSHILIPKVDKIYCNKKFAIDLVKCEYGGEKLDAFAEFLLAKNQFPDQINHEFSMEKFLDIISKTKNYSNTDELLNRIKYTVTAARISFFADQFLSGYQMLSTLTVSEILSTPHGHEMLSTLPDLQMLSTPYGQEILSKLTVSKMLSTPTVSKMISTMSGDEILTKLFTKHEKDIFTVYEEDNYYSNSEIDASSSQAPDKAIDESDEYLLTGNSTHHPND